MKTCPKCKNSSPDNAAFCAVCGGSLETQNRSVKQPPEQKNTTLTGFLVLGGVIAVMVFLSAIVPSTPSSNGTASQESSDVTVSTPEQTSTPFPVDDSWMSEPTPRQLVEVEYEVYVSGKRTITYTNANGDTEQVNDGKGTWTKKFKAKKGNLLQLSAQNGEDYGSVTLYINVDGAAAKKTESSGAYCIASSSYSIPE